MGPDKQQTLSEADRIRYHMRCFAHGYNPQASDQGKKQYTGSFIKQDRGRNPQQHLLQLRILDERRLGAASCGSQDGSYGGGYHQHKEAKE